MRDRKKGGENMEAKNSIESSVTAAYKCGSVLVVFDKGFSNDEPLAITKEKIRYARTIAQRIC